MISMDDLKVYGLFFLGSHDVILGLRVGDKSNVRFHIFGLFMLKVLT